MQPEPQTGRELDQSGGGLTTDPIDLRELVNNLLAGKWWIAAFTLTAGLIGFTHAVSQDPVYEADALIQIEAQRSRPWPGMEGFQRRDSPASAQIQILRSRSVLGEVVDAHELNISATPLSPPALLQRVLGSNSVPGPAPAPLERLAHYDWGGSRIELPPARRQWREFPAFSSRCLYVEFTPVGPYNTRRERAKGRGI